MKSAALGLFLIALISTPVVAAATDSPHISDQQAAAHLATAKQFVEVIGVRATLDSSRNAALNAVSVQLHSAYPNMDEKTIEFYKQAVHDEYAVDMDALIDQIAEVYAKHFSEEELSAMIAFYRTDVGRKYVAEIPAVAKDIMELQAQIAGKALQKFEETLAGDRARTQGGTGK